MRNSHRPYVLVPLLVATGCYQLPGVSPTLHPTTAGEGASAGISAGALHVRSSTSTTTQVPYGEGWIRLGDRGQAEVRVMPSGGYGAYNIHLPASAEAPVHVTLQPSVGMSLAYVTQDDPDDPDASDEGTFQVAPGLSVITWLRGDSAYIAPRVGLSHTEYLGGADGQSGTSLEVGGTIGARFGDATTRYSLEVTVLHSSSLDGDSDSAGSWAIVPSLGMQLGR